MIVLDTHVLAWAAGEQRKLGRKAKALIERLWARGEVAVCGMSFWEAALLQGRGRLLAAGLVELAVDGNAGIRAVGLGGLPNDPVDRLIVATALHHRAALMSADERLLGWENAMVRHDARL